MIQHNEYKAFQAGAEAMREKLIGYMRAAAQGAKLQASQQPNAAIEFTLQSDTINFMADHFLKLSPPKFPGGEIMEAHQ